MIFELFRFRHVAGDTEDGGRCLPVPDGSNGTAWRVDPTLAAVEPDVRNSDRTGEPLLAARCISRNCAPVVRMHQIDDWPAHDWEGPRPDHLEAGAVHVQQNAVVDTELHAGGLRIDDGLQPAFAAAEDFFSPLAFRDVLRRPEDAGDASIHILDGAALRVMIRDRAISHEPSASRIQRVVRF